MHNAIQKLIEERDLLHTRLQEISVLINEFEELESRASKLLSPTASYEAPPKLDASSSEIQQNESSLTASGPEPSGFAEYEAALRDILMEASRPLQRKEVLNALTARGIVVGGTKELNTLGTRLHRTDWVVNLKGFGYWLKARDFPEANHRPTLGTKLQFGNVMD
jgi:hypothetical protein